MLKKLAAYIRRHDLLQPGAHVLIAVSGGVDSMVLLDLLRHLADEWPLRLTAAHFNHRLRGAEAEADEQFVREHCATWGIPVEAGGGDVRKHAREQGQSLETAGRELRYAFLREAAVRRGCGAIATAHHASDQAETVLDRLIRGAGVRGLAGIPIRSEICAAAENREDQGDIATGGKFPPAAFRHPAGTPASSGAEAEAIHDFRTDARPQAAGSIFLIRPLLFAGRHEIDAYAALQQLAFREDTSNQDHRFRRNRIRHELLPLLKHYNPQIESTLAATAAHLREMEAYLCGEAQAGLQRCLVHGGREKIILEKEPFLSYFSVLQKYILQEAWKRLGGDLRIFSSALWNALDEFIWAGRRDRGFALGAGELWLTERALVLLGAKPQQQERDIAGVPGLYPLWNGYLLEIKAVSVSLEEAENNAESKSVFIDAGLLQSDLSVRTPRPGDRFHPLGLQGHKKVADLLSEAGVPVYERQLVPLLVSGDEIVWLCGIRLNHQFRLTPGTGTIYQLKVDKNIDAAI